MPMINTNVASLQAIHKLNASTVDMNLRLGRLSSGLRINSAKDDPAGLIASETLRAEISGINQAISNSERASSVIGTAEGALNEVSALMLDLKALINNSANTGAISPEEIKANQAQIDSSIASINRIANATMFEGVKLLNGQLDFVTSGVVNTEVTDLRIDQVRFGATSAVGVTIAQVTSAQRGSVYWSAGALSADLTIAVAGNRGVETFTFQSSATWANIAAAINQATAVTGVSAVGSAGGVLFQSAEYGSKQFVKVNPLGNDTFDTVAAAGSATAANYDYGQDLEVAVNGVVAVGDGLRIKTNGPAVTMEIKMAETWNTAAATTSFSINGGGAQFQIGPQVNAQQMNILGIQSVAAYNLGNSDVGYLRDIMTGGTYDVSADQTVAANASDIVDASIQQVAELRSRLGAFQKNALQTNINSLNVSLENVTASESAIRDADFAKETAAMTRSQILVQAGTKVLALANAAPQNVLALLG